MCGIAGLMTLDGRAPDRARLDAMIGALGHRGPDGHGSYVQDSVGLAHNRLAIIDLATGDQPLYGAAGLALVANGEIYNHVELRADLGAEVNFRTGSDCEPPLALYARLGAGFADQLRGMYAIALHDPARKRLVLARDPFGIKPLYYAETASGFAFASEPQALLAAGLVERRVDRAKLVELLQLQFTTGRETVIPGIHRVMPGETLVIERGVIVEHRHRAALPEGGPGRGRGDLLGELDRVLAESVEMHQRADVPYGMFLSGGIDSSVVLALMSRLNPQPVLAFTAGFPGTEVNDEREHARLLAERMKAEHVDVPLTEADFWRDLPAIAAAMDDPAADYAVVPTWKLAAEAGKRVKVILSGEGGDELFGGYGRYRHAMRPWPLTRKMRRTGSLDGLELLRDEPRGWRNGIAASEAMAALPGRSRLQIAQAVDVADWLPNDLLTKLDRCLMAHGVEGRVPFLDPVVARFAYLLPDRLKVKKGMGKWILRKWLNGVLPEARPFSPKRGFTVPVGDWIAARPELGELVARRPCIQEICRPGAVETLFRHASNKRAGFAAWTLLFYSLWHHRHMEEQAADAGVFDVLAG